MTEGTNPLTAADVAAVTRSNDGYNNMWGSEWFIWIILIAFLFNGNWGNNQQETLMADEFIKRDIFNTNQNVSNTACQTQRDVLENRYATQLAAANLGTQIQLGTAETQKEVLQNRYDAALQAQTMQAQLSQCCCDIKETILADGQATRALIQNNTIQDLRDRLADRDRDLSEANNQLGRMAMSNNIISTLQPTSKPAYITASPYAAFNAYPYGYGGCASCGNVS